MLQTFKNGQGSVVLRLKILDSTSSTGAGLTGVASTATGMIISTIADVESTATAYGATASVETIATLGTFAAPTATRCRWREVDSTNHKGIYELQLADARFAVSSAKSLLVSVAGATNMAQADFVVQLQSDDPFVAKPANFSSASIDASGRVDIGKILGSAVDTTASQLGVRLNNIMGSAVDSTASQLGVRVNNADGTAWNSGAIALATFAAGAIDSTVIATDAIGSAEISSAAIIKITDGWLDRDMSVGADNGSTTVRTPRQALRFLRNKWDIAAGVLTVKKEDDATTSWTSSVSTDSTAVAIIGIDPAGP
jgi:hypothetical protein